MAIEIVEMLDSDCFITEQSLKEGILKSWLVDPLSNLEIEVGSNAGHLICRLAKLNQNTRFIGIDLNRRSCEVAVEKITRYKLSNVKIINMEAHRFIAENVLTNSVRALHIYFPTPNPQAIGLDRRLINRNFLEEVYRILISGGALRIVTDHNNYFKEINMNLRYLPWWDVTWSLPSPLKERDGFVIYTPCEQRYSAKSKIHKLQVLK
jgi:tRNA G46 methylase TrmB